MDIQNSTDFQRFRSMLSDLLSENNEIRARAESVYDEIPAAKKPFMLITAFVDETVPNEEAELAAVLLRRLLTSDFTEVFGKLEPAVHTQIQNQLLHRVQQNIKRSLRRKICDVIAELVRNYIDDDGNNLWPEFLKFLFDAASSPDPVLREMSLLMFSSVPGVFGNQESRYMDVIRQMLIQCLKDQQSEDVRYAAVKATSSFILAHEKEVVVQKQFGDCLNLLLLFLVHTLEDSNGHPEDILRHLVDLVESCPQFVRGHLDIVLDLCIKASSNPANSEAVRHLALEITVTLSETAPAMVRKLGSKHIPTLIALIFRMMTELEEDPNWEASDDESSEEESDSDPIVGEASLDRLACALGGKTILPLILSVLPQMLNSSHWKERHAGLMTISAVGEGCHKQMSAILSNIVDGVLPFLNDPHSRVRYSACNALGQMSTDFAGVFQKKFHEKVIAGLLELLGDRSCPRVQAHAGAALVNFFDDCPKYILPPYMDGIVGKLEAVLNTTLNELVEKGTKLVLEQVVVTLASLADTSEEKFTDYYEKFMPCLKFIIQNATQPELRVLRGKAIECISLIGLAVGKEKFMSDATEVMDMLLKTQTTNSIAEDDPQFSYMIAAWARICKILGKAFEPYLPYVMEPVLKAAALKPEIAVLDADDMKVVENDDNWEFVNLGEKHNVGIKTAGLEEKATACQMLVCYARELKESFSAYAEDVLKLMLPMLKFYFHDGVRVAAAEVLPYLLESAKVRGESYVQEMWGFVLPALLQALESEPESEVLCEHMSAFSQCVAVLNCQCLSHENLVQIVNILCKYLIEHFERFNMREDKRREEDYDDVLEETFIQEDDDDIYVLSKISEMMGCLFAAYKQEFFPYFDMLLPHFVHLLETNRPWSDKQWSLCVFADVIQYGGPACSRYQQYFLRPVVRSLADGSPFVRQTAAYTIGNLGQFGGPEFAEICKETIPVLMLMINDPNSRSDENICATENAISAVTKFLVYNNSFISMEDLIPAWVSWLPVWEDKEETKYVYSFLCTLLEGNNPLLLGNDNCNLPRIVQIVAEAFYKEAIDPSSEVGVRVINLMRHIQSNGELFSACVGVLNPQQRDALLTALTPQ